MKLALVALALVLSGAAPRTTVLGWDYGSKRISWFDAGSLTPAKGGATGWYRPLCSWSFSPDRHRLALSDCNGTVRLVAVPSLATLGRFDASAAALAWVTPTRLLAVNRARMGDATLLVVDTTTARVVRRVGLGGMLLGRAVVRDQVVLLLAPVDSFGPARVVAADANGALRSATIDGIAAGSHGAENRTPGFAVDPAGTAFVVGADLRVAEVDLSTMRVSYHGPTRAPAKALNGTTRIAAWLGGGRIAVSGIDSSSTGPGTPFGLQLLDTSTWTYRTLDSAATGLVANGATVIGIAAGRSTAYDRSGAHRYDIPASRGTWVTPALGYAYVCSDRWLTAVLDASTGASVSTPKEHTRGCPTLFAGRAAPF